MSPEEIAATATVAGAVIAGLFGITGFVVGLTGLHYARKAKESAAKANLIAKDANSISKQANTLSTEANGIAQEANEIARAGEVRATEQHDVTWDCDWKSPGVYAIRNEGKHSAHQVWIQITVDNEVREANFDCVVGGETVLLEMPETKEVWKAEQRNRQRSRRPSRQSDGFLGAMDLADFSVLALNDHYVRDRVLWRTKLGTPREHDRSSNLGSAGP